MKAQVSIEVDANSLERVGADLAVVGFFVDQRPLRGGAGIADWRLCGWLSELLRRRGARGEADERILLPTFDRLRAPRVLVLGLGAHAGFGSGEFARTVGRALEYSCALGLNSAVVDLPTPEGIGGAERYAEVFLQGIAASLAEVSAPLLLRVLAAETGAVSLRAALEAATRRIGAGAVQVLGTQPTAASRRRSPATARAAGRGGS